ncbi:hypothetical protein Tco_1456971 [Tanacetum coccineum]
MKRSQDMQLIQKLRDDQKRMKKVFEVMSGRNIVTNSRVTSSWREIVSFTFSEAGVFHVNWTSLGHCVSRREFHKIINDEIAPLVNQVDARVQNFKNHFVKEAAKFVRDFKSLAKEANESLDKILVLEKENERLLRIVVSQDIMSIVQSPYVVKTSDLQTGLERTKERFLNKKTPPKVPPKVVEMNDLSNPVTSNLVPTTNESQVVKNDEVISPGMFMINPSKTSREDKFVPINKLEQEYTPLLRPERYSLGAMQRMIRPPLHLRVVAQD